MLSIKALEKSYTDGHRKIPVVQGVNIDIERGEIYTLLGPSGCGKTTIIRCIAGLETPDSGEIWLGGRHVYSRPAQIDLPVKARNIGMVFQSYALWPHLTVFENVAFPMRYGPDKISRSAIRTRVMSALEMVKMQDFAERKAPMLSGGQQQRVALARALVYEPDVLLLDEPLSNLDAKLRTQTRTLLRTLVKRLNITTLCVTHDQEEALAFSDRIAIIRNGRILQSGAPKALYEQPNDVDVANFLGEMNFFSAITDGRDQSGRLRLNTRFGTVLSAPGAHPEAQANSAQVWVTIRPHQIAVKTNTGGPMPNSFSGRVSSTEFLGSRRRYSIGLGTESCTVEHSEASLEDGSDVVIELAEQHIGLIVRESQEKDIPNVH
jgi:iron(III) transport system ATP-binding protein